MVAKHNDEVKVKVSDINSCTDFNESLTMFKIVAMSNEQIEKSKIIEAEAVFKKIEKKIGL